MFHNLFPLYLVTVMFRQFLCYSALYVNSDLYRSIRGRPTYLHETLENNLLEKYNH